MSPIVWGPNGTSATTSITYQCSGTSTCACGNCTAVSIVEPAPITLTNLSNTVQPVAYTYVQNSPAVLWRIVHNLNFYPNITVIDSGGSQIEGEVNYLDSNSLVLTFTSAFSGHAYLS
jgi:hypothetical protein